MEGFFASLSDYFYSIIDSINQIWITFATLISGLTAEEETEIGPIIEVSTTTT